MKYEIRPHEGGYGIFKDGVFVEYAPNHTMAEYRVGQMMEKDGTNE